MNFIGIDLAWTYKNETGFTVITQKGDVLASFTRVMSDEELVALIISYSQDGVWIGVDAPLVVKNMSGSRAAEPLVMKDRIHGQVLRLFIANRKFLEKTYGMIRGERLLKQLNQKLPLLKLCGNPSNEDMAIVETFPTGNCLGLFPKDYKLDYKLKAKISYEKSLADMKTLLKRLSPMLDADEEMKSISSKKAYKQLEDKVDGFLCAYGLYEVYHKRAKANVYGFAEDGAIFIAVRNEK